jgi:N-6 DNA Methylase
LIGTKAAHSIVTGIAMLGAHDEAWLRRCQALPEWNIVDAVADYRAFAKFDEFLSRDIFPGFDTSLRELYSTKIPNFSIGRVFDILASTDSADLPAVAKLMVRRAATQSGDVFTVPSGLAELAARLAVELSPTSQSDAAVGQKFVFDPHFGCGEMLLEMAHYAGISSSGLALAGYEPSAEALGIARAMFWLSEFSQEDLILGEWLERPIDSGPKIDYLVSAIPATSWRHLDYRIDYTIPVPARPRSFDSTLLYLAKISRIIAAAPQAIAVVAVNSSALTIGGSGTGEAQLRQFLIDSGTLHAVIALPNELLERTSTAPVILVLRHPPAGASNSFRLVDARNLGRQDDRRQRILSRADIEHIIASAAGTESNHCSEVLVSDLSADGRWRIPLSIRAEDAWSGTNSPPIDSLNEDPLEDICEILPGRNRVRSSTSPDGSNRVVRAQDISEVIAPWSELKESNAAKSSSVSILPGDIIGSISPPYGRWVLVPSEYGPALASDHTIVLRKRADVSMRYLLGYLRSDRAKRYLKEMFRGTVSRLDREQLAKLPVPKCPLGVDYLDKVLDGYDSELVRLEAEVSRLRGRLNEIYRGESAVEIAADVDALHGVTASLRSVENLNDPLHIAMASFPYPISRTLRAADRTKSARIRYHEVVHQSLETISTVLTSLAASVARDQRISGSATRNWTSQVRRNGATIGVQRSMFAEVARAILTSSNGMSDVGGLGQALGDSGSPAVSFLTVLLEERNRIHGDYPRSEYEFEQRIIQAEDALRNLLDSLSFLARWELRYAEFIEPIPGMDNKPDYSGQFAVLRGDNPDWSMAEQVSKEPLYRGRVYAQIDQDRLIDVHPYLLVLDCRQCGSKEVYYPDSYDSSVARLKSIDRGHPQDCTDQRILQDLQSAFSSLS